jgi:HSP20 family protein
MREMSDLRHRVNQMFGDMLYPATADGQGLNQWNWNPVVDIYDNDDSIVIKAELPGVEKKDISIDVKDRHLILKGERSVDNEVKEEKYYRRERSYGSFQRIFSLPVDVDTDKIEATYADGLLKIEIPKPETQKPRQITVH